MSGFEVSPKMSAEEKWNIMCDYIERLMGEFGEDDMDEDFTRGYMNALRRVSLFIADAKIPSGK
jgi:hypothetical protein